MQAIIMAGGFGTRLRPLTCNIPKPMAPLMNMPIIGHIIELLKKHDFYDITIMLYFQPDIIKKYIGDGSRFGVNVKYKMPEADLGTAGSVKCAIEDINERFLVISGDLLTDVNLTAFKEFHSAKNADASILLTKVPNPLPFGIVMTDKDDRITQFLEKPSWGEVFSDRINSGIYLLEPSVFDNLKSDTEYDFGKDIFPGLLEQGANLYGYTGEGYWKDIGNLDEYLAVHQDALSEKVDVSLLNPIIDNVSKGIDCKLGENITFEGSVVLGNNVTIKSGAMLQNAVIGNNVTIGNRTKIINSILWDHVSVDGNSQTKNAVIGSHSRIGSSSIISDKVFIGEDVSIGDRSLVKSQVKIWPQKTVVSDTILSTSLVWGDRWLHELFTDARVSGIANTEITAEFAARLGSALGAFYGVGASVFSCRDMDKYSYIISNAIHAGMNSMGVNVEDLSMTPIPVIRQVLKESNHQGGVHIRKSPYVESTVDIIVFDSDGLDLTSSKCKKIERMFFGEDYPRVDISSVGSKKYSQRPVELYEKSFLEAINISAINSNRKKAVIDFSYGPASTVFPKIIQDFNLDLITLNGYLNPSTPYYTPAQRKQQADQLAGIVCSIGADVGFIIDQTCERLFLVDNNGRFFGGPEILTIAAKLYISLENPQFIGAPLDAPTILQTWAEEKNIGYYSCKSSHRSMIKTAMKEGVGFVGGTYGGLIFTDFSYASDAMFAMVRIIEMLNKIDGQLSDFINKIQFPNIIKKSIACSWEQKGKVMGALMQETEGMKRELLHGIKIYDGDNWLLFLPEKEEPLFSITVEAVTADTAESLIERWADNIRSWRDA